MTTEHNRWEFRKWWSDHWTKTLIYTGIAIVALVFFLTLVWPGGSWWRDKPQASPSLPIPTGTPESTPTVIVKVVTATPLPQPPPTPQVVVVTATPTVTPTRILSIKGLLFEYGGNMADGDLYTDGKINSLDVVKKFF